MKKTSELIWELALAMIAFAGAATLIANFFPSVPIYIYGIFFAIAFITMLIAFGWRLYEYINPIKITSTCITFVPENEPFFFLQIELIANSIVNINNSASLVIDEKLFKKTKDIVIIKPICRLKKDCEENIIKLNPGEVIFASTEVKMKCLNKDSVKQLEEIDFYKYKMELRINIHGRKRIKTKLSYFEP